MRLLGFTLTKDKEIIDAIKIVEELRKVNAVLRFKAQSVDDHALCKAVCLSAYECRELDISRHSYISSILSRYKLILEKK